jgi:hypothetical protein
VVDGEAKGGRRRLEEQSFPMLVAGDSGWKWLLDEEESMVVLFPGLDGDERAWRWMTAVN